MGKGLPEYRVLGWESEEAQRIRFDIMISSICLDNKKILDVGCGMGNLLDYLKQKGIKAGYTGVDILQSMIELAESKNPDANFYCLDIFKDNIFKKGSFDVVYASGIFNLDLGNNREFLLGALILFLDLSREAVIFNLLHHNSPDKEDGYFYLSPDEIKQTVERIPHKVKRVNIMENYLQNDLTVGLFLK